MPLLPSALPPKGEARRYVANDFLNLIALLLRGEIEERRRRTDPVSGSWDTAFHSLLSLPLLGGLSYNAICDKNYAK